MKKIIIILITLLISFLTTFLLEIDFIQKRIERVLLVDLFVVLILIIGYEALRISK